MKRESVLEARTGNNNCGSGIAFDLSNAEDDKHAAIQKKKKELKFCKWCNKNTNHKTWMNKYCVFNDNYIKYKESGNIST